MNRKSLKVTFLIVLPGLLLAADPNVVFIGITPGDAPAFEETLDRRIRDNFSSRQDLLVTDYPQTQSLRNKLHFDESPSVSRRLVEALRQYSSDSTMVVWGSVKKCAFTGFRTKLIRGHIRGEMVLALTAYSQRYKNYAFSGDIRESCDMSVGFFFFGDPEKEIIVSTPERTELTDRLLNQVALKASETIATAVSEERSRVARESPTEDPRSSQAPSLSDMFNVPSVEAASVQRNRKKTGAASDSAQKQSQSKTGGKPGAQADTGKGKK